jgi:hypothetical protein
VNPTGGLKPLYSLCEFLGFRGDVVDNFVLFDVELRPA